MINARANGYIFRVKKHTSHVYYLLQFNTSDGRDGSDILQGQALFRGLKQLLKEKKTVTPKEERHRGRKTDAQKEK